MGFVGHGSSVFKNHGAPCRLHPFARGRRARDATKPGDRCRACHRERCPFGLRCAAGWSPLFCAQTDGSENRDSSAIGRVALAGPGHQRSHFSAIRNGLSPIVPRHDPPHERVEHRHRERRIAVAGAPDHALGNEQAARWRKRGNNRPVTRRDVSRAVRPRP